jgi:hypothetical protein
VINSIEPQFFQALFQLTMYLQRKGFEALHSGL